MKFLLIFISILLFNISLSAQKTKIADNMEFNGYIQVRGTSNFDNYTSFSIRRLKLWVKSKPEFSKHWSYKIQTTFTNLMQEKFFLQDVKIGYKTGLFSFDIGQFVPQYSLQRFQADYTLPVIERALAINMLIPNGTMGVRDIGLQTNFTSRSKIFETHMGLFNGYGIKEYRFKNRGYLLTHKSGLNLHIGKNKLQIGYSLQYRKAENLQISHVLADSILFSGDDFRYNIFARIRRNNFELQAEYLNAKLNREQANGWYILSAYNVKKNQIVFSYEKYNDLISTTNDNPYFHIGYNYLFNDNKIKLYFTNTFQFTDNKVSNNITSIQLQIFIK